MQHEQKNLGLLSSPIHLVFIDFETTMPQKGQQIKPCPQIIRISAKHQGENGQHNYCQVVKPSINCKLTKQCTLKTGLKKQDLKQAPHIQKALQNLCKWMNQKCKIPLPAEQNLNFMFITWGIDFETILIPQLKTKKINIPHFLHSYLNIKHIFKRIFQLPKNQYISCNQAASKAGIQLEQDQTTLQILSKIYHHLKQKMKFEYHPKYVTILKQIPKVTITPQIQYLLVLDFEATCEDEIKLNPCSQIIQFPIIVVDLINNCIRNQEKFHYYVTPTFNPNLTKFCTQLTGITQQMVTGKPKIDEVLEKLDDWILSKDYLYANNWYFVTCGDWDLANCLKNQAKKKNIIIKNYLKRYINIKKCYNQMLGEAGGMMRMLKKLNIPHQGRHHSGIDDVKNICEICLGLKDRNFVFDRQYVRFVK